MRKGRDRLRYQQFRNHKAVNEIKRENRLARNNRQTPFPKSMVAYKVIRQWNCEELWHKREAVGWGGVNGASQTNNFSLHGCNDRRCRDYLPNRRVRRDFLEKKKSLRREREMMDFVDNLTSTSAVKCIEWFYRKSPTPKLRTESVTDHLIRQ